jgi:nucleoside-diphosphate-sugar epimerase
MKVLVTGSAGHFGEALVISLREAGVEMIGLDLSESPFTDLAGSITDPSVVPYAMSGVDADRPLIGDSAFR